MGPWNSSGALVCFEFAIVLPCEGGVRAGMEQIFLSPLEGLSPQVMGNMDNFRRGWVECIGPLDSRQDTGDMFSRLLPNSPLLWRCHSVQGTHGLNHYLPSVGSSLRPRSHSGH